MGDPEPGVDIRSEDYIILDDIDSYLDSDDDHEDEQISWSLPPIKISSRPPYYH